MVKWFRDTRFRQAVSYAVDRRALVQNVLRGMGYPETSPYVLNPGTFYYPDFKPYAHDVEKAKALLAEMGLKDTDGDGILDDGQGHKVAFTLTTNSENTVRVETIEFIRKDLQKVGMDVNLLPLSFNLLMDKLNNTYDWEAMVMGMTGTREPQDGANIWLSSGWINQWWPKQKTPSTPWEKRIDDIYALGVQEMNPLKRKDIYREWIQIIHDQQPVIYLTVRERVIALRNKYGNIFPSPWSGLGAPEDPLLHNDAEIFVK
jgi:peptide/nickel transport system substrate-binding protein